MSEKKLNIKKRRAEEAEERGRYRETKGLNIFAMISYVNAKQLYEETKNTEKLKTIKACIQRVENYIGEKTKQNNK
jgi:hypothetical protein